MIALSVVARHLARVRSVGRCAAAGLSLAACSGASPEHEPAAGDESSLTEADAPGDASSSGETADPSLTGTTASDTGDLATADSASGTGDDSSETAGDSDHDGGEASDTGDGTKPRVALFGRVLDPDGVPVDDVVVALCDAIGCKPARTDPDGDYRIEANTTAWYTVELVGGELAVNQPAYRIVVIHIDASQGDRRYDLTATRYTTVTSTPTEVTEVEIADGLLIELGPDSLSKGWSTPHELDQLGGTRVLPDEWVQVDGVPPIVAMWHLAPFDAEADAPVPLRIRNDINAELGERYTAWQVDYLDQSWRPVAQLEADESGFLVGSSEFDRLNTVVLTRSPAP
ncbi:MAG: hypothetical protein B7733_18500 [Myxococcales bacterium FL481]|nr:MAG: hypothetical protein B7733_18500 [Myxococcales bacterium FL481]